MSIDVDRTSSMHRKVKRSYSEHAPITRLRQIVLSIKQLLRKCSLLWSFRSFWASTNTVSYRISCSAFNSKRHKFTPSFGIHLVGCDGIPDDCFSVSWRRFALDRFRSEKTCLKPTIECLVSLFKKHRWVRSLVRFFIRMIGFMDSLLRLFMRYTLTGMRA